MALLSLMKPAGQLRLSPLPIVWAAACVILFAIAFFSIPWPYVDAHNNLREATTWNWRQYIVYAFSRGLEYRPLLTLSLKAAYEIVGLQLWWYQALVLAQFAAVLGLLVWLFRPVGVRRGVAAVVALACVVGLHTSRSLFLFVPLNAYSASLVAILLAMAIALDERARTYDWLLLPLTGLSLFVLESSLLIVPVVIVLWWMRAPGVGARGVAATLVAVALYLAVRFGLGTPTELTASYTGSGLGFSQLPPETLRNIFEHAPWLFWIYNVTASVLTVLASEPRAGTYRFVASLLAGSTPFWNWLHVISSLATTIVVALALMVYRPLSPRDRWLAVGGLVLVVTGSGLGFLYTRDRIALSAGVGYAMVVYVGISLWLERVPATPWKRWPIVGAICLLALAWCVRGGETFAQLRDTAWDFHQEWTDRYPELGGALPQTPLLTSLRAAALSKDPVDPRRDPGWTYVLFERRFSPEGTASGGSVDAAADAAVLPQSAAFDVRWRPDVDDAGRLQLEAELGLTAGMPVDRDPSGRTWEYRLRMPTRERVRAIVLSPAVEDTARIDPRRFEILQ